MEITFEKIPGRSASYRVLLGVLGGMAVAGILATWYVIHHGLGVTGMNQRVPWGLQIVMAVYYIGLSAGSLVISGLYGVFGKTEYKPFARLAVFLAMLFLIAGLMSILTDQGRMDRIFVEPFYHFNLQSMFSINPSLYLGHILICVIYLYALFKEKPRLTKFSAVTAFGWAFCVHSGTGAIFGFGARELYQSPLLPASFVSAALASGTAFMIIMIAALFKITRRHVDASLLLWLGRFLAVCILVVLYFMIVENAYRAYLIESREAAGFYLFHGLHAVLFWVGLIFLGLLVPMTILFIRRTGGQVRYVVLASAFVVFGVLCERYVIVMPALLNAPNLFPGMEAVFPEPSYTVSIPEILQALGVLGAVGFIFVAGLRVLPLLPNQAPGLLVRREYRLAEPRASPAGGRR